MQEHGKSDTSRADPGETVFDDAGRPLGTVTAMTEDGFEVETQASADLQSGDHEELPGQGAGEGYIMWRCADCGEMGELDDGIPSNCPNCGASEEMLSEVVED